LNTLIILIKVYYFCEQCFIDGGKMECVESMVFDVGGQIKEGGMQVLSMLFCIARIKCSSNWAIDMMVMGKLKL
jgi:hypothetical protein